MVLNTLKKREFLTLNNEEISLLSFFVCDIIISRDYYTFDLIRVRRLDNAEAAKSLIIS